MQVYNSLFNSQPISKRTNLKEYDFSQKNLGLRPSESLVIRPKDTYLSSTQRLTKDIQVLVAIAHNDLRTNLKDRNSC